jgi:hypothetical protein
MIKVIFSFSIIILSLISYAQSLTPQVIASAGNYFDNGTVSLSWTLGEPVIETYTSANTILTQGFHQPELLTVGIATVMPRNTFMSIYPNPTMHNVTFDLKYFDNAIIKIDIINNLGQIVSSQNIDVKKEHLSSHVLNMNHLASGMYQIRVTDKGQLVNNYKINKVL